MSIHNIIKKHNLIYQITNIQNGMIYIGAHSTNEVDDGYMGSGHKLLDARREFGADCFKKTILHDFDNPYDMYKMEFQLVNVDFINNPNTYNMVIGGQCTIYHHNNTTGCTYVYDPINNEKKRLTIDSYEWQYGIYDSCLVYTRKIKYEKKYKKPYDYSVTVNNGEENRIIKKSELLYYKNLGWMRGKDLNIKSKFSHKGAKKMISPDNISCQIPEFEIKDKLTSGWRFPVPNRKKYKPKNKPKKYKKLDSLVQRRLNARIKRINKARLTRTYPESTFTIKQHKPKNPIYKSNLPPGDLVAGLFATIPNVPQSF